MPEVLKLTCFELPCDAIVVRCDTARGTSLVYMQIENTDEVSASISLDAERARVLFNWLGVWLHTPKD